MAFPVAVMCDVVEVSPSGYYAWCDRKPSARAQRRQQLGDAVEQAHRDSKNIYGYRKVHREVVEEHGQPCSEETVRTLMRAKGLRGKRKRGFVTTTDSRHALPVAPNILDRHFEPDQPNQTWVGDITYIPTCEGWLYLAAVMDLCGRRIVGWSTSAHIDTQLVSDALHRALRCRKTEAGLLFHSDRGVQYASHSFQSLLGLFGITCSMSRKGNCWDNACMERFFGSLKSEWIEDTIYPDRKTATTAIFEYIELFYNTKRRHAALDYKTPIQYEAQVLARGKKAA